MVVPMEQWASQPFQDKSTDLSVAMLSDHNKKYSDRMESSCKAFAVTFELRFPFRLNPLQFEIFWGDIVKIVTTDQYCNTRGLLRFNIKENKIDSHLTSAISLLLWFGDIPGTFYKQEPFLITWFNFNPSMDK